MFKYNKVTFFILLFTVLNLSNFLYAEDIAGNEEKIREYITESRRLINLYDFDGARELFSRALEEFPDNWRLNYHYIKFLQKSRIYNEENPILKFYKERYEKNPENVTTLAGLAYAYIKTSKRTASKEYIDKLERIAFQSLPLLHVKAEYQASLFETKGFDALKAYDELLSIYPDYFEGYLSYFDRFKYSKDFFTGKNYKFQERFDKACKLPDFDPIIYNLEIDKFYVNEMSDTESDNAYFKEEKNSVTANGIYQKIIDADPSYVDYEYNIANFYYHKGENKKMLEMINGIIAKAPNFVRPKLFLAKYYSRIQEYDKSNQILIELKNKKIDGIQLYDKYEINYTYAGNFYKAGKIQEFRTILNEIAKDDDESTYWIDGFLKIIDDPKNKPKYNYLKDIPNIIQKNDYCGPASLSMILQYWKLNITQDDIAEDVYSKGHGSDLKASEYYAKKLGFKTFIFEGTEENWKKLIDMGLPVLWVKYAYRNNLHAVVLAGYDDFTKNFIFHDPNLIEPTMSMYGIFDRKEVFDYDSEKPVPKKQLKTCLLIIPEDQIKKYNISFIKSSSFINMKYYLSYLINGSAINSNFLTAVFISFIFISVVMLLFYLLTKDVIFPLKKNTYRNFIAFNILIELIICVINSSYFQNKTTVTIMLGFHVSLILYLVILTFWRLVFMLLQYYMRINEFIAFEILGVSTGILSIFSHQKLISERLAVSLMILIAIISLAKFFYINLVGQIFVAVKNYKAALRINHNTGRGKGLGNGFFISYLTEAHISAQLCQYENTLEIYNYLLTLKYLTRKHKNRIRNWSMIYTLLKIADSGKPDPQSLELLKNNIEILKVSKLDVMDEMYLYLVQAEYFILQNDYLTAKEYALKVESILNSRNTVVNLYKLLEIMRTSPKNIQISRYLNDINLLRIYNHLGDILKCHEIIERYLEKSDIEFRITRKFFEARLECETHQTQPSSLTESEKGAD